MALIERVTTLIRANINDLVDRAEDPEKMLKQVILDMENQLLQVKTQVAISIADLHMLEKKLAENRDTEQQWVRRAEMALDKKDEALARAALERSMSASSMAEGFAHQLEDQKTQVEALKASLIQLRKKLDEAHAKREVLIAQHRRSRALSKANAAGLAIGDGSKSAAFDRLKAKVHHAEATAQAHAELAQDDIDDRLAALEKHDKIEQLLTEMKAKRA